MVVIDGVEITEPNNSIFDYQDTNWKEVSIIDWFQFCKANHEFREPGISYDELRALHEACEMLGHRPLRIVETGMCFGTTTRYFIVRTLKYGGELHTYEINIRPMFQQHMEALGLFKHIHLHGHSITDDYDKAKIDLLWIDSEHALQDALCEYVRFRPYFYEKTIIGFHDTDMCSGVAMAINMIQEMDDLEQVSVSINRLSAGARLFRRKKAGRTDRPWHKRKGYELCQVPLKDILTMESPDSPEPPESLGEESPQPEEIPTTAEVVLTEPPEQKIPMIEPSDPETTEEAPVQKTYPIPTMPNEMPRS